MMEGSLSPKLSSSPPCCHALGITRTYHQFLSFSILTFSSVSDRALTEGTVHPPSTLLSLSPVPWSSPISTMPTSPLLPPLPSPHPSYPPAGPFCCERCRYACCPWSSPTKAINMSATRYLKAIICIPFYCPCGYNISSMVLYCRKTGLRDSFLQCVSYSSYPPVDCESHYVTALR